MTILYMLLHGIRHAFAFFHVTALGHACTLTIYSDLFLHLFQAPAGGAPEAAKPVTKEEVIEARDAWISAVQVYTA